MGKFLLWLFGLDNTKNLTLSDYEYYETQGDEEYNSVYRKADIVYENNSFDGGEAKKEKGYKLYKTSDLY